MGILKKHLLYPRPYNFALFLNLSIVLPLCMKSELSVPLQVLEEDSGPKGSLCRLWRLSLLLLLQRKAWDETFHFNAAWILCSQRHMAHSCQGQGDTKHHSLLLSTCGTSTLLMLPKEIVVVVAVGDVYRLQVPKTFSFRCSPWQ